MHPLLNPDMGLLFWTFLSFLVVFFILAKYAWPAIVKGLKDREQSIADSLATAERVRAEMAQLQSENEPFGSAVVADTHVAKSFMLERPGSLDLSGSGSGLTTPVNCSKKVRTTRSCSTQARGALRLEGGPGMWNGIL